MSSMNDESANSDNVNLEQSSSIGSKRHRRSKSIAWEEFERLPISDDGKQRAKCNKCGQSYIADSRSGTTNLLRHLLTCPKREGFVGEGSTSLHPFKLDQVVYREKMSLAIIKHNYPFMYAEHEGNRDLHSFLNPYVKSITRNTAKADVIKLYKREKEKLKHALELIPSRICLTSDLWTSLTTDGYMTLTGHYVDENWVLQKRILNFHHVPPPHNGPILAEKVISLLKEWGIEKKIFTLTLDNASYNDGLVDVLKNHLSLADALSCEGEFFHVRCGAHILNLIVQEGLKVIDGAVYKVRESVKYVRGTQGRKTKFAECITQLSLTSGKKVRQDVPTRWNSTYLMLESALIFRRAFCHLQLVDSNFKTCPSPEEWNKVEKIAKFLKPFYEITTLFSGTKYPTANLYFNGVWKIQLRIMEEMKSADEFISNMANQMKRKFDKYWECYSMVLAFAVILDPRYKLLFVEFCFTKLNSATAREYVMYVREKLYLLFEEYICSSPTDSTSNQASVGNSSGGGGCDDDTQEFDMFESQHYGVNSSKSQLDLYLEEPSLDRKQNANLDILSFWKVNRVRYPELSMMARDILSIPITTVASESAFSIGGRIIDKYRNSIVPKNAEALLCTRDWLFGLAAEEDSSEEEQLVEDFSGLSTCSNIVD